MEIATQAVGAHVGARRVWIQNARWDMGWLIGSAAIVPVVLLLVWGGVSSSALNLGTTALIGGPHLPQACGRARAGLVAAGRLRALDAVHLSDRLVEARPA
jgi:hypothetical protein